VETALEVALASKNTSHIIFIQSNALLCLPSHGTETSGNFFFGIYKEKIDTSPEEEGN